MILERPEEPGKKYALALTVLVHVALATVLFLGVQWKRSAPEVYEVELWSARPQPATQAPPPPPPETRPEPKPEPRPEPKPEPKPTPKVEAPKKPDIVLKEEKKKPEPKKPEPKPEPPKPEPKKPEPKLEPKLPDFSRELASETSQLKSARSNQQMQQLANAAAAESAQRASANSRGKADYINKIRLRIKSNLPMLPPGIHGNPEAIFEVSQLPSYEILEVRLKRSSGNPALDRAIENAIRKSSPLPAPPDPSLFQRTLEIKYKPFEE